jgi:alkanesulfonate monooxygenase
MGDQQQASPAERHPGIQFIGIIRTDNASEIDVANAQTVEHTIDLGFVSQFAQAHEEGGFDRILIGYRSTAPYGCAVAQHAARHTERLHLLAARSRAARSRETR